MNTNTGVTQDTTDTTTTGINALAANIPGAIQSNITTDGQYVGTTGTTAPVGTKVGQGTIAGSGSEANTGTRGPIINFGGTSGFTTSPTTLAQQQLATQAGATTAAQNAQLDLYKTFMLQNPNATDADHANFMDKVGLSPAVASRAHSLSGQQMQNRYYDAKYNTMTGDSRAAFDFLRGRGPNPATQTRSSEIMRPYSEAVMGVPAAEGRPNQKFIFQNGKYVENPNYRPMSFDSRGERRVGMTSAEVLQGLQALPNRSDDAAVFEYADANNITLEQLAAALNISRAEAQRRRDAAAKKKKDDATATTPDDGSVGGANGGLMPKRMALGGLGSLAGGGQAGYNLGGYSDGGRLLRGPGDGVSDSIPATIGNRQPARLADGEFVVPARIVSELGNGSTEAGARKLYAMMDRVQKARGKTTGKNRVAANTRSDKYLPA